MPKCSEVDISHPSWRGDILSRYHALLVGGTVFDNIKSQFLLRKPSEGPTVNRSEPNSGSPGSQVPLSGYYTSGPGVIDQYRYRLQKTSYKPVIPSLFGYLASKIFPDNPDVKTLDNRILNLVDNTDGLNKPLAITCREALINALTYSFGGMPCGGFLQLCEDAGEIKLNVTNSLSVIDWEDASTGLNWVRTRTISNLRDGEYGPVDKELWTWKIYNDLGTITYTGTKKIGSNGRPIKIDGPNFVEHEFGMCPFIRIDLADYQFLMDQIAGPIIEQFNLESDIASLSGKISNAQFVIKTNQKDIGSIVIPQLGIIVMDPADSAQFESPDPTCCEPLFKYRTALRDSIYNSINSSVMRSSADFVQNPRQSGVAKEMDLQPWEHWSESFAQPVKSAVLNAFKAISNFYEVEMPEIEWSKPLPITQDGIKESIGDVPQTKETNGQEEQRTSQL